MTGILSGFKSSLGNLVRPSLKINNNGVVVMMMMVKKKKMMMVIGDIVPW